MSPEAARAQKKGSNASAAIGHKQLSDSESSRQSITAQDSTRQASQEEYKISQKATEAGDTYVV